MQFCFGHPSAAARGRRARARGRRRARRDRGTGGRRAQTTGACCPRLGAVLRVRVGCCVQGCTAREMQANAGVLPRTACVTRSASGRAAVAASRSPVVRSTSGLSWPASAAAHNCPRSPGGCARLRRSALCDCGAGRDRGGGAPSFAVAQHPWPPWPLCAARFSSRPPAPSAAQRAKHAP